MAGANPFSPFQTSNTPLIDELVGSPYPHVRLVAQNIDYVKHVSANLESIYTLAQSAPNLGVIIENIDGILAVSENAPDYSLIIDNIIPLTQLGENASDIINAAPISLEARDKAQQWANNPENDDVEPGLYSALHWASKAAVSAASADSDRIAAQQAVTDAEAILDNITAAGWAIRLGTQTDGARLVLKIIDYVGGTGTPPTTGIGLYAKGDGTYTANIAEAADLRGPAGPGSGDMLSTNNLSELASKPTAFNTIKQVATASATGVVELATDAEAIAMADTTRALVPSNLAALSFARLAIEGQTVSGGAGITIKSLGNLSGQILTPSPANRGLQTITNNGPGSILPSATTGIFMFEVINTTGAGAITLTGWDKAGDNFDTTTTSKFLCTAVITANMKRLLVDKVA